jgi:hypothetical protein
MNGKEESVGTSVPKNLFGRASLGKTPKSQKKSSRGKTFSKKVSSFQSVAMCYYYYFELYDCFRSLKSENLKAQIHRKLC